MENKKNRIAAIGDIHVHETDRGKWTEFFRAVSRDADMLIICGDLTDTGHVKEAEILSGELKACTVPVVAVLGNHDYEADEQDAIKHTLMAERIHILDGESIIIGNIGFAGVKGFGGGFDNHMLPFWGEKMNKNYVQESVNESLKLDKALARLDGDPDLKKIVLTHYAPIKGTVLGEPESIFPFLGSSRLAEPINRREVIAAFHGHAHIGTLQGETSKGVKVFNVSKPVLQKAGMKYFIFEC
jgi:Icc-related predicted phosphoesterase